MNGYQRIRAVLNGEWPDKRPVMLHNFMMAAREAGLTMINPSDRWERADGCTTRSASEDSVSSRLDPTRSARFMRSGG